MSLFDRFVIHGDCVEVMARMSESSVDAIVCDPPYGLEFMGKAFDPFVGSGTTGIACVLEWFKFVGVEQDAEYAAIARARIEHFTAKEGLA